jgi:hypothetical protein
MQRQAGELRVEVVGRFAQIVRLATMTTSTRAALRGTNSTRSNTAASCAGRIANPTPRDASDSMCETCGSSESSRRPGLSRRSRASTAVADRLGRFDSSSKST